MLSCTEYFSGTGRFCDIDMIRSAGFNSHYGAFLPNPDGAGKKTVAIRREIIGKLAGQVKALTDSGVHVITYMWIGGFDRRLHDPASGDKFKGEFAGPPAAWVEKVKDYVRACYNNPDWIDEVANDAVVQMEEGHSEGIFLDVTVPLNHCICKHCCGRLKEELGLDLKSMPLPAFSEVALDQMSDESDESHERIDYSDKKYRDYLKWRLGTYVDFFRQVRKKVEQRTGRPPVLLTNSHSNRPEYIYCYLQSAGVLDGVYFEEGLNYPPENLVYPYKVGAAAMPGAAPLVVTRVAEGIPTVSMLKSALAEGVAFGGYFTPWGFYIHESDELVDALRQYNEFFRLHEDMLADQTDRANVAVIQSLTSDMFYWQRRHAAAGHMAVFLTDMHVPFELLLAENGLDAERLGKYTLLILPNMGLVSDAEMATYQAYLDAGGKIIATGDEAFCFDETMRRRDRRPEHENLFYIGGCDEVEYADNRTTGPDYFCKFVGPDGELADLISQHATPPILDTDARVSTAINLTESDQDILVHMVNLHVNMLLTQLFIRPERNVRLRLRLAERVKEATLLSPDIEGAAQPLDFTQDGEWVSLTVPQVVHYTIIRLRKA